MVVEDVMQYLESRDVLSIQHVIGRLLKENSGRLSDGISHAPEILKIFALKASPT